MEGKVRTAFAAVRPPGHHAAPDVPGGFCLFNNVAVGARHAQAKYGVERVAILDFDVHHGQGTQAVVEPDPTLFYASTHQYPLYPGTGSARETGTDNNVVNVPLPPGSGGAEFRAAWAERILPLLDGFAPELVIVSAGFDAHRRRSAGAARGRDRGFRLADRGAAGDRRPPCPGPAGLRARRRLRPRRAGRVDRHARAKPHAGGRTRLISSDCRG